jgi:chromosome segregation ATPase
MMTNTGMFEDAETIVKQKEKIKELKGKVKNLEGLEEHHRKNNGDLRTHIKKLEKEIFKLKKDKKILEEGNEALGIEFRRDPV